MNVQTVDYTQIVSNIESELNALAEDYGVAFRFELKNVSNIYVQKAVQVLKKDMPILRGVFIPSSGEIVPIQGLYSFTSSANIIFACADTYREDAYKILSTWTVQAAGASGVLTDDENSLSYTMSTDTPSVGAEQTIPGVGQGVTIGSIVSFQFIADGATGNMCVWEIDGMPLTDISSRTQKMRTLNSDQRENNQNLTAVAVSQSPSFNFTLPYVNTPAIKMLVEEMLSEEKLDAKHILTYYDNVVIPETEKVSYTVIAQAIAQNNEKGVVSSLEVVFVLAQTD